MTTSLPPDPWKALGLERDADKSEIRTAYKKLVLRCHPDKVQDPTLKALKADEFQKVQQAWELLNDDAEKAKYEQKLRLAELQRAAKVQQDVKNSPNTSVPRTKYATYDIRTAEPPTSRYKSSPSGGKVYTHYTTQTRSHEEMPSSRVYPLYEETDKQARRAASYEKPAKRDDEKRDREREERRRRRDEDEFRLREKDRDRERDRDRDREREKAEKEREARKAEKKRLEKEREKERRREADDKHRPAYVEENHAAAEAWLQEDELYVTSGSRSEKKRSSSRKHDETRERDSGRNRGREKSSSRRAKTPPPVEADLKHMEAFDMVANYLKMAGNSIPEKHSVYWSSELRKDPAAPPAPTPTDRTPTDRAPTDRAPRAPSPPPPPHDFDEEMIRSASYRAAGRRASNDPARSREKLKLVPDGTPPKARPIPTLAKSYSTPPQVPESPPSRISRSQTAPHEVYEEYRTIPAPSLMRTQTWAPESSDYWPGDLGLDDDRDRRRHRSRRTRSPSAQPTHRYKVEGGKTSKVEAQYLYSESPTSSRRYATDPIDGHMSRSPSSPYYSGMPYKVKQTKSYGPADIKYSELDPVYYSSSVGEGYPVKV
jgi:curved DNA-binding protein CbpA